jgi:hypothetical protein
VFTVLPTPTLRSSQPMPVAAASETSIPATTPPTFDDTFDPRAASEHAVAAAIAALNDKAVDAGKQTAAAAAVRDESALIAAGRLVNDEDRETGNVSLATYRRFFALVTGGALPLAVLVLATVASRLCRACVM